MKWIWSRGRQLGKKRSLNTQLDKVNFAGLKEQLADGLTQGYYLSAVDFLNKNRGLWTPELASWQVNELNAVYCNHRFEKLSSLIEEMRDAD